MHNFTQAQSLYQKSAQSGNVPAQSILGSWYEEVDGWQDSIKAATWHQLAASNGNAESQYHLAKIYADGKGVPKSNVVAYALCILAGKVDKGVAPKSNYTKENLFKLMSRQEVYIANNLAIDLAQPQNFTNALATYFTK
jgi:Sel1 repeat